MECCLLSVITVAVKRRDFPNSSNRRIGSEFSKTHCCFSYAFEKYDSLAIRSQISMFKFSLPMHGWRYRRSTGLMERSLPGIGAVGGTRHSCARLQLVSGSNSLIAAAV